MPKTSNTIYFLSFIGFFALFSLFLVPASVSATIACGECTTEYCRVCQEEWRRISAQGIERRVVNASDSIDLFVPIKEDSADWDNFRDKYATGGLPSDFIVAPSVCGNGKYWDESILWWNNPTEDLACSPTPCGSYSGQEDEPHACSEGTYQSSTGQTSCVPASAGYRVAAAAACSQTACTPGNYQNLTGQTNCKTASAGYHVSGSAADSQTPCNNGTYQPNTGQSSCLNCPTCRWSGQEAASSCYVVSSGQDPGNHCMAGAWSCIGGCARSGAAGYCDGAGSCDTTFQYCPSGSVCSGGVCTSDAHCYYGEWNCSGQCSIERDVGWCDGAGACGGLPGNQTTQTANCGTGTTCSNGSSTGEAACAGGVGFCMYPCAASNTHYECDGGGSCSVEKTTHTTCPAGGECYEFFGTSSCSSFMPGYVCPATDACTGDCTRQRTRYVCDGSGPSASACTQHYSTVSLSGCGDLKYCDGGVCKSGYYNLYNSCSDNQCYSSLYGEHCGGTSLIGTSSCTGGACQLGECGNWYCDSGYVCVDACRFGLANYTCAANGTCSVENVDPNTIQDCVSWCAGSGYFNGWCDAATGSCACSNSWWEPECQGYY